MSVTVYASGAGAAQNLLAVGLLGLAFHEKNDSANLEAALSSIEGVSIEGHTENDGIVFKTKDVPASAVLAEGTEIDLHYGTTSQKVTMSTEGTLDNAARQATASLTNARKSSPGNAPEI